MSDCLFCRLATDPSAILYQDELSYVIKDIHPKAPIHLLYIPKQHLESLQQASEKHRALLTHMMLHLNVIAERIGGLMHGFRTIINTGPGGNQEIPHLHFHILGDDKFKGD